jgi:proteasome lid subunit RPN8/RPN11
MSLSINKLIRSIEMKFWNKLPDGSVRARLNSVSKKLARAYREEAKRLITAPGTLAETEALHVALSNVRRAKAAIDEVLLKASVVTARNANALLAEQRKQLQHVIQKEKLDTHFQAAAVSILAMNLLFLAEDAGANGHHGESHLNSDSSQARPATRMTITSDLLYQMHHNLFPAERMLVAAGTRSTDSIEIRAIFEVTGKASSGHVRADPERLARALIAMDLTETHFALWIHSHPGTGIHCTQPSSIDLAQHKDWLRDYSADLVSAIMVQDRWIRFWGNALETGCLSLQIMGAGIIKEESDGTVLRLEY